MNIATNATERTDHRAFQGLPRRMRRVTVQRGAIRLLQRDHAARTAQPDRLADHALRIAGGAREKAHMHEIKAAVRQVRCVGVALPEFGVRGSSRTGMREEFRILIEPDHASGGTDAPRQRLGEPARAAAEIEARPARAHADQLEHDIDVACERRALDIQALDLARAALNRIAAGEGVGHPLARGHLTLEKLVGFKNWLENVITSVPFLSVSPRLAIHSGSVEKAAHFCSRSAIESQASRYIRLWFDSPTSVVQNPACLMPCLSNSL